MAYWNFSSFTNKLPLARNTWNIGAVKQLFRLYHLLIAIHTKDSDLFRGPDAVPTFGTVMFEAVLQSISLWQSPTLFHPTRHPLSQPSHTSRHHDKTRFYFLVFLRPNRPEIMLQLHILERKKDPIWSPIRGLSLKFYFSVLSTNLSKTLLKTARILILQGPIHKYRASAQGVLLS